MCYGQRGYAQTSLRIISESPQHIRALFHEFGHNITLEYASDVVIDELSEWSMFDAIAF